ncbi:MAG: integration host factor subunit alpha [Alphaproteobacteria bacterium]|nr:integration host factor subunit alpha [Alphaproteobacteria bacterium]
MTTKTITRANIAAALHHEVGLTQSDCAELLETVLNEISGCLAEGETVKICSFGSFSVRQKGQRMGRNPKTLEDIPITPRRVIAFRPSQKLR